MNMTKNIFTSLQIRELEVYERANGEMLIHFSTTMLIQYTLYIQGQRRKVSCRLVNKYVTKYLNKLWERLYKDESGVHEK